MKKTLTVTLDDDELLELYRVITDGDEKEALAFLVRHFKGQVKRIMEGAGECRPPIGSTTL